MHERGFNVILDRECKGQTGREIAKTLGISLSLLYKFKSGKREITPTHAKNIAKKLKSTASLAEQLQLEEQILCSQHSAEDSEVKKWFESHSNPGNLMIVEFREPPALSNSKGSKYLKPVAAAVANGLRYAIILPFGNPDQNHIKLSDNLKGVVKKIHVAVTQLYLDVSKEAYDEKCREVGKSDLNVLRTSLLEVHGRIQLYVLNEKSERPVIGNRLFYIAKPVRSDIPPSEEEWAWHISPLEEHSMEVRPRSNEHLKALLDRYFPLVDFWREYKRLPVMEKEILDFADKLESNNRYITLQNISRDFESWTVFRENKVSPPEEETGDKIAERAVDDYMRKAGLIV